MKILALVSQKGGAGKSLISAHLAVAFEEIGIKTVVIDLDRQESITQWGASRKVEAPTVVAGRSERLALMLDTARRNEMDLIIIDTPPHSDRNALSAVSLADMVLIPIRPEIFDLRAVRETVEILQIVKKQRAAAIVLNAVPPSRRGLADEAEEAAKRYGIDVAPIRLTSRAAFSDALVNGQGVTEFDPKGKAADEIRALRSFVHERIKA